MESRDCCGKSIARKSDELHEDHRSERIPEKSETRKHAPGCLKFRRISEEEKRNEIASCYDKFALAKRLHAENLQHQPLPDRVNDSIFKKYHCRSASCERDARYQDRENVVRKREEDHLFHPALGYKKPETRMDLAICWETPIDPVYEPRRPTHIDGSEGGSAPAIFALIQHTPVPRNRELLIHSKKKEECDYAGQEEAGKDSRRNRCGCDCSCNESVAESRGGSSRSGSFRSRKSRSSSLPRITERKCVACRNKPQTELEQRGKDPRLIRSAVGVALDLERKNRTTMDDNEARRKELPSMRLTVPRPRTPFARRAFSINTLAPPFSIMKGCRDADYPEYWRLMSVYQQSYRNPQKRKTHYS